MTFRFILIFSLLFQTFEAWAQDSIPANTRARLYFSPTESFVSQIYENPAINYYAHTFSISELQIGWEQQNANKAFLPQLGSEVSNFSFHAFSYMPLGENSKTWGNAYFKKGKREKDICPETKWVEGSNYVDVNFKIDERTGRIVMMGALDNLVKGAAGQAVQNMNLLFGFDEAEGLNLVPMFP